MLKYIYVFILIIILFWIKWKLQKNNKIKEEFYLTPDEEAMARNKLADMFSSSDRTTPTFYDKLNILKSIIDVNDDIIFSVNRIIVTIDDINKISLFSGSNGNMALEINDMALYANNHNYDNYLMGWKILGGGIRVVSMFDKTQALNPMQSINTSVKDLIEWHNNTAQGT